MDKYKYQLCIALALMIVGALLGSMFTSNQADKAQQKLIEEHIKELRHLNDSSAQIITANNSKIAILEQQYRADSVTISSLQLSIKKDGVRTEQRRRDAQKYTPDEKANFLINRYTH